jgi:pimeloyl-ACP methyl ester carboxylesterase
VAGWVAVRYPSCVKKLVLINAPHWPVVSQYIRRHPGQMLKSVYAAFFQIPRLPEILLGRRDYAALADAMVRSSRPGTFSEEDLEEYRRAWRAPGALTTMVNWYRALTRAPTEVAGGQIEAPTLLVWGKKDAFLQPGLAQATLERCKEARLIWFEDATHWVHHEKPKAISEAILQFVKHT